MDHNYSIIFIAIFIAYDAAVVDRSVVDKNQFKIKEGLSKNTIYTAKNELFNIIYRDNY